MITNKEKITNANNLLKQSQWREAGKIFHEIWNEENNAYAASRYLHCLRKADFADVAIQQGKIAMKQFPDNKYIKSEVIWSYYDAKIKSYMSDKAHPNLVNLISDAETILKLQPDDMPRELVIFAVIKNARAQGEWYIVSDWCDKLDPLTISADSPGNQKGMSRREQWFFAKVKSLMEIKQWQEARSWALKACKSYPKQIQFQRWSALALGEQGQESSAIQELEEIIIKFREEWYILQDIGELYAKINQPNTALKFFCRSALCNGEDKLKVSLYLEIAEKSLVSNKLEMAANTIALSKMIRQREGWKIKDNLEQLEKVIDEKLKKEKPAWQLPQDITKLQHKCHKYWKAEVYAEQQRYSGIIDSLPSDKKHGWILNDNGDRIFFLQRDLPSHLRREKLRVNFLLEQSWDRKKNKRSVKAIDICVVD